MPAAYERLVKKLKKAKKKGKPIKNPFALAHYIENKQEGTMK
jgi:hypothetical protein